MNRAPAPQLPARINNNNNITSPTPTAVTEPTREQLTSIKKYQVRKFNLNSKPFYYFLSLTEFTKIKVITSRFEFDVTRRRIASSIFFLHI